MKEGGFWERVFTTQKTINYISSPDNSDAVDVDGDGGDRVFVGPIGNVHTTINPIEVIRKVWIPRAIMAIGVLGLATCMCTAAINSIISGGTDVNPTPISSPATLESGQNWAHFEIPKPSATPTSALQMQIVP